jgi:hypothetical protein
VPQREWAVLDRIPLRQVTLHSGHGAAGKSLIELQRGVGGRQGAPSRPLLTAFGAGLVAGASVVASAERQGSAAFGGQGAFAFQ